MGEAMPLSRALCPRAAVALLLAASVGGPAVAQDLHVETRMEPIQIGHDLELDLLLPAEAGSDAKNIVVQVDVAGGPSALLIEQPLPLRAGARPGHFIWAAPTRIEAAPGRYLLTVSARSPAGEQRGQTEVTLAFGPEWTAGRITHFIAQRGLPLFLALVFLGGVLMSLTPCIYPMIPITLAVLGAQAQTKGVARSFLTALTYGVGLSLVYGIIGVISATVFSGITAILQSPAVLVPIALLMVGLSFAMFGAYELEAPAWLRNRLQGPGGNRMGLFGAFAAGMVAGLVASPCVGPFLAALLVWVGTTGNVMLGFWSLFAFGLGLSTLLVAVGTFPALLRNLPQSGGWMQTVRKAMGLLLLYMAFYFVRPPLVLPATVFLPLLGAVTILVAVFVGAFDRLEPDSGWWPRTRKGLGLLGFLTGIWLLGRAALPGLLPTAMPVSLPAPPPAAQLASSAEAAIKMALPSAVQWQVIRTGENVGAFLADRIAEARTTGRPIIIDFWATWCAYCKKLDRDVWTVPEIVAESQRFQAIKIDATRPDDADMTAVKEMFRVPGLPTVAFIDTSGRVRHAQTLSGWHEAPVFLAAMRAIE